MNLLYGSIIPYGKRFVKIHVEPGGATILPFLCFVFCWVGIFFFFCLQRDVFFYDHGKGKMAFVSAYSGDVCTMTIVGVSFRTGLRG